MTRILVAWFLCTALGAWGVNAWSRVDERPMPDEDARAWALDALDAARAAAPLPPAPASAEAYRASDAVLVYGWLRGRAELRHVGTTSLTASVRAAAERFRAPLASRGDAGREVRFTVTVPRGEGPIARGVPYLAELGTVPMLEGVVGEFEGRRAYVTPDEIWSLGAYDRAVVTPIPDLSFGTDLGVLEARLARDLGTTNERFARDGVVRRFRAGRIARDRYPGSARVDAAALEHAALEGVRFLARHQSPDGRYKYLYDGRSNQELPHRVYNVPRHAGTTYFLAQAAHLLHDDDARQAALRGMAWLAQHAMHECGRPDHLCITEKPRRATVGATALAALAAAEMLADRDALRLRPMLQGFLRFLRAMQRPDGELMHDFDLTTRRAVDVQRMYYSGEAAYALLKAHALLEQPEDLDAARRLMSHLTGSGWRFFGSRYFYGEEHWTCQAVGAAVGRIDVEHGIAFCMRWLTHQGKLQYRAGQTPWESDGAYGVTPVLVPRATLGASRCEAGAQVYPAAVARGLDTRGLRDQIERALRFLMRLQWTPGPAHLLFDPLAARGGVPETEASSHVRADFVQHAGSAMLLWADVLRREAAHETPDTAAPR